MLEARWPARPRCDDGLHIAGCEYVALAPCAVHGLDALGDDDNERGAHEHTSAQQGDDTELARRESKGQWEDASEERAAVCELQRPAWVRESERGKGTHAMAMIVLRASSMKSPSHMMGGVECNP